MADDDPGGLEPPVKKINGYEAQPMIFFTCRASRQGSDRVQLPLLAHDLIHQRGEPAGVSPL